MTYSHFFQTIFLRHLTRSSTPSIIIAMCGFVGCTMDKKLDPGGTVRGGISTFGISTRLAPPRDSKTGNPQVLLPAWANLNLRWRARLLIQANTK